MTGERPSEAIIKHISNLEQENKELLGKLEQANKINDAYSSKVMALEADLFYMKGRILPLSYRVKYAEMMVERLIEAGNALDRWVVHFRSKEDATTATQINWNALVAEWRANQEGDSNV